MSVTAIEGVVEGGRIRLRDGISLPESTRVYVIVPELPSRPVGHLRSPHLAHSEQARDFQKQVIEVNGDAAL